MRRRGGSKNGVLACLAALLLPILAQGLGPPAAAAAGCADPKEPARLLGGEVLVFQFDSPQDYDAQGRVLDESGYGARGLSPTLTTGRHGNALDYLSPVSIEGMTGLDRILGGDFTVSLWYKTPVQLPRPGWVQTLLRLEQAAGTLLELTESEGGGLGTGLGLAYIDREGVLRNQIVGGLPGPGAWGFFAITVEGATLRGYSGQGDSLGGGNSMTFHDLRRGSLVAASLQTTRAGMSEGGPIDEVRVYDRALTQEEARSIMLNPYCGNRVPVVRIPVPAPVECVAGLGRLALDGNYSYDPDGDPLNFAWSAPRGTFAAPTQARTEAAFPPGGTVATLRARDGQAEGSAEVAVLVVDSAPPTTELQLQGQQRNGDWWTGPVEALLRPVDLCGVARTLHALDGGAWAEGERLRIEGSGLHGLQFRSLDLGGNEEAPQQVVVSIDELPPRTVHRVEGLRGNHGWWRSAVEVVLAATDDLSGVASTYAAVDHGPFVASDRVVVQGDGLHRVRFHALDEAGNREADQTLDLWIDTTPPSLRIERPAPGCAYLGAVGHACLAGLEAKSPPVALGDIAVLVLVADAASHVCRAELRVDGAFRTAKEGLLALEEMPWAAGAEPQGLHLLTGLAEDCAGNVAEGDALRVSTLPSDAAGVLATLEAAVAGVPFHVRSNVL